jgi:hypothetical protein
MERPDKRIMLRNRARERFGAQRAEELDAILCQVAADLETMEEFNPDPNDGP